MRKETLFAVIAGLTLGLVIAFGVWRINSVNKEDMITPGASPTPTSAAQTGLTIAKPNNDDVETIDSVIISGIAAPDSWIVISDENQDYIIKSNSDGSFEEEADLTGGINQFVLTALNSQGETVSKNLRLVFSSQLAVPESSSTPESTESGIRERVAQKVEEVLNSPKAYIGTVTDITDTTVQLKSDSGEILQVSIDEDIVTVVKTEPTQKEVKLTDVAIGDYIAALGYTNGNHVLTTKRILIISPQKPPNIKIYFGKIKSINKKEITLDEIKFTTKLTNLKVGDEIIVVGTLDEDDKFTARKSFLAETAPTPSPTSKAN